MKIDHIKPADIESASMRIIREELAQRGKEIPEDLAPVVMRVIHATADFDFADNLRFSPGAAEAGIRSLLEGSDVITDTNMAKAGIRRRTLENFGGTLRCFMADKDVAEEAKRRGITRASASMEHAARLEKETGKGAVIALGNAPTALIRLHELIRAGLSAFLVRNTEDLAVLLEHGLSERIFADAGLYTWNREAERFLKEAGIRRQTAPLELNSRELRALDHRERDLVVYGRIPLMVSAGCIRKHTSSCRKNGGYTRLIDRKKAVFPVEHRCRWCYSVLYNSLPLDLSGDAEEVLRLRPASLRLSFTEEDGQKTRLCLDRAERAFCQKEAVLPPKGCTKGHFHRGVE